MPTHSNAVILKASAGSGKTFTLAKEFIKRLILNPVEYHQLLALTFTNDAKNEMKSRILKELSKLAAGESTDLYRAIEGDFKTQKIGINQEQIFHRSDLALTNILNDYSRFNVSTLDHFFTQLIRHLARELKLSLGYELDLDINKALSESIHSLYHSKDKRVKKWLRSFINSKIEDDKGWNIEFNIKSLGNKLFQDSFIDIKNELKDNADNLEDFVKQLQKQVKEYETAIQLIGKQAIELIQSYKLNISDFKANTAAVFNKLNEQTFDLSKPFSATFLKGDWANKTSNLKEEIEACANGGLTHLHTNLIELTQSEQKQAYVEASNLLSNIYSYGVLSALSENLWDYRSTNNLLLLSDTAFILNGVIAQSDAPFIYEKMGARYNHIMIDEFQDTSSHQWKNILPLLQHALFDEGSLLLVGDVKQSIYRWRGGDVNLLMEGAANDLLAHSPLQKALDTNYRSGKNIIAFNNAFFDTASSSMNELLEEIGGKIEEINNAYADLRQQTKKEFEGYVNIQFFADDEEVTWKEQAFTATEQAITSALTDGFSPEDILVLVRKNKEAGEVAEYLLSKGINTITDEALHLEKSPLVQFLLSALQLIINPNDRFTLTNFSYFLHLMEGQSPSQALKTSLEKSPLLDFLTNATAYEAIEQLIEAYHLNKQFDPFLQGFQDLSLSLIKQGYSSITSFTKRWDELNEDSKTKPSIILGKTKGAVRVKSIHKSKGLESPVVIIPQMNGSFYNTKHIFWPTELPEPYTKWASLPLKHSSQLMETRFAANYEKESYEIALEEVNTMYVAFTRAIERLYIFVNNRKFKNSAQNVLKGVLENPLFPLQERYIENVFELGTLEKAQPKEEDSMTNIPLTDYPASNPETKLSITQESSFWKQLNTDKANYIKEGIIVHAIMAQLTVFEPPELDRLLKKIISQMVLKGTIPVAQPSYFEDKITTLFTNNSTLYQWFSPGWMVVNEHKIIANGNTYIPDRVIIKENKAVIIDFKKELKSDKHNAQIRHYGELLSQMDYKIERMLLVYIDTNEMVEVL